MIRVIFVSECVVALIVLGWVGYNFVQFLLSGREQMVKVFPPIRDKSGQLIRGFRMFSFRKPGPADLTWEEKNDMSYLYIPKDTSELQKFVDENKQNGKCL